MEATSHLPILFLTARGDEDDKVRGLEMGADDYMVKPFSPRELVARLRALVRRSGALADDDTWVVGAIRLDKATHRVSVGGTEVTMGPTEFNLLQFLIQNPDRVFSRDQLLDAVWGRHVVLDERTVDVHIRRLRKALAPTGADGQVQTVRGAGYRLSRGA
jgi:two-component system phosphate regulon response regulator PhoB